MIGASPPQQPVEQQLNLVRPHFGGRTQLLFAVFLLLTLNAFTGHAVRTIEERGVITAAFELFGISAILWVALAAGLGLLSRHRQASPLRPGDRIVALAALAAALLPFAPLSSFALTLVSLWAIATSPPGSDERGAAIIFLTITGALLWGRLLLAVFSGPLLGVDAVFTATAIGAEHRGNMLWLPTGGHRLVVAPGCSSMQGISLALVFWATVNQYFKVPFGPRALAAVIAAVAATIAVNVLRIGAMLRWPDLAPQIHHGWGWQVAMWATLILVVLICGFGARREILRPR